MQLIAMAGVPNSPGHVAAEKDRYYVHWQLGVPRPHKKDASEKTEGTFQPPPPPPPSQPHSQPKNHENPAQKTMTTQPKTQPKHDVNGPHTPKKHDKNPT